MTAHQVVDHEKVDRAVLAHDLGVLENMVLHMGGYLMTDATRWDVGKSGEPPITLGGYLMRRRRLGLLADRLPAAERERLAAANEDYDNVVARHAVRFESRAVAEIGARMREWTTYLRDVATSKRLAADHAHYVWKADTRVVITDLIDELRRPGYPLPDHVTDEIMALDHRLQARWAAGPFIWAPVWELAYSPAAYWWLYGYPMARAAS